MIVTLGPKWCNKRTEENALIVHKQAHLEKGKYFPFASHNFIFVSFYHDLLPAALDFDDERLFPLDEDERPWRALPEHLLQLVRRLALGNRRVVAVGEPLVHLAKLIQSILEKYGRDYA